MTVALDPTLLRKAIRSGSGGLVHRMLERLDPAAVALLLVDLAPAELKTVIHVLMPDRRFATILQALPDELLPHVLDGLDDRSLADALNHLEPDDAVWIVQELEQDRRAAVLGLINAELRQHLTRLMRYPPDQAGNFMIPRFVAAPITATVGEAIAVIRAADPDVPVFYLYVTDEENKLVGVLSLSALVRAADDTPISALMRTEVVWVPPHADQATVAHLVSERNLLAVPVVAEGELIGLVTVDDVIDILEEEATQHMYNMAGLSAADRVFSPPRVSLAKRLPWNMLNLCTSMCAAVMVSLFETTIGKLVALATFMPVVAGIGGNTGNQTLIVIIRGISLGELEFSGAFKALLKEVSVGISIGLLLGTTTGLISYLWKGNIMLGVVIALAMVANLFVAAFVGTMIPLTLRRLGFDPALGGTILLTMFTDVFGFFSFLGLATLLMHYLM